MDFNFAELSNICDEECMVVQYVNESKKPVGVGFEAWVPLVDLQKGKEELINCEKKIWWPVGVDGRMPDAKRMKKMLKDDVKSWQIIVVKILAFGERVEMTTQAKTKAEHGYLVMDRFARRAALKKKQDSSSGSGSDNASSDEEESDKDSASTKGKKTAECKAAKKGPAKKRSSSKKSSRGPGQANSKVVSMITNKQAAVDKESPFFLDADEESDDDLRTASKDRLLDQINILKHENSNLKKENSSLRRVIRSSEKISKIEANTLSALDLVTKFEQRLKTAFEGFSSHQPSKRPHSESSSSSSSKTRKISLHQDSSSKSNLGFFNKPQTKNSNLSSSGNNKENTASKITSGQGDVLDHSCTGNNKENTASKITSGQGDVLDHSKQLCTGQGGEMEIIDGEHALQMDDIINNQAMSSSQSSSSSLEFGGRKVPQSCIDIISGSKNLSKYTNMLLTAVFSEEELRTCSLTGATSNFQKAATKKKALPQDVLAALLAHIKNKFEGILGDTNEIIDKKIKSIIRTKLNNSSGAVRTKPS